MSELKSGELPRAAVLLLWVVAGYLCMAQEDGTINYDLEEEGETGEIIGNLVREAGLDDRYTDDIIQKLRFTFLSPPDIPIAIGNTDGLLRTTAQIDREAIPKCQNHASCQVTVDVAVQPHDYFEIIKVVINIVDINDNEPEFEEENFEFSLKESASPGSMFFLPSAHDDDGPRYSVQQYQLIPEGQDDTFSLMVEQKPDGSNGVKLKLTRPLDREVQDVYALTLWAYDGGQDPKVGSMDIRVTVLDSNDNDPVFDNATYRVFIPENIAPHSTILRVHATDRDIGLNGQMEYRFAPQTLSSYGDIFGINKDTGEIFVKRDIDHETSQEYALIVTAQDLGPDSQVVDTTVFIQVQDINDNAPQITVHTLSSAGNNVAEISEYSPVGTFVASVTVEDLDSGANGEFECRLNDDSFTLQPYGSDYRIFTTAELDRERIPRFSLALICEDHGEERQTTTHHIQVTVTDENDHSPVFAQSSYMATLLENKFIGASVIQANASDQDIGDNSLIRFSLSDNVAGVFSINEITGKVETVASVDREANDQFQFHVYAADQGDPSLTSSALVVVTVEDVNDERPEFTQNKYTFSVEENQKIGTEVATVDAYDADTFPNNVFSYSFIQGSSYADAFYIDSKSGSIITQQELDRERHASYFLVIAARDSESPHLSSTASVTINVKDQNDNAPQFQYPTVFNNTVYLSNRVPVAYNICHVRATDRDVDANGKVSYSMNYGNEDGFFHINPTTGIIQTNSPLIDIDYHQFRLKVEAKDHGIPERRQLADLNVIVNKSLPYPLGGSGGGLLSKNNVIIVISVACGCAVVTVVLIIAIVCIRRQDKISRMQRYNCRMEAIGRLAAKETMAVENGPLPKKEDMKAQVSHSD